MLDSDRPIIKSEQDQLNRTTFAKYLARCMLDHKDVESLVVGLYGPFGSGKTSLINLIKDELTYAGNNMLDEEKPILLNFSPWSYSGQHQLIYNFFRRLSSTIKETEGLENKAQIIHLLDLYSSYFTDKSLHTSLPQKRSFLEDLAFKDKSSYAWDSGLDLTKVKAELNELLSKQKHKIIIIIDNISQIYDSEIKEIFQIIKSIGNFSNTVYLLAFDKERVIKALNKIYNGYYGEDFLEKVIQLSFEIPPIIEQDLEKILADRLNEVIKLVPEGAWNSDYWAEVYYSSLKFFFKNCRDITRYVNTLHFSYARVRDVVNPVDFFAITAIEVFLPTVYYGIRENKDLFTDLLENVYSYDDDLIQKDKLRFEEILTRNNRIDKKILLNLLMHLFPRMRRIYYPDLAFYHSEQLARKLRRICSADLFEIYFRLSMQLPHLPESEFETILASATDPLEFDHALTRLNQDDKIIIFLNQLDSNVLKSIPMQQIPSIINALLDNGDLFPQGIKGPLNLDTPMRVHRIIHHLLQRFPTSQDRFEILQHAIANTTKSIFMTVYELQQQSREHLEQTDTFLPLEFRDVTPEQLNVLKKLAVKKIESWATNGTLIEHPQLLAILYAWRDWGDETYCMNFVHKITENDRGLIAFLMATLNKPIAEAMVKYEKTLTWETYLDNINAFISAHALEKHAKDLFEDEYFEKLREKEQLSLMIFLDLIKTRTKKTIRKTSV